MKQKTENKNIKGQIVSWIKAFAIAFLFLLVVRAFFAETFVISSVSMENTLIRDDIVIANKLNTGVRIPMTPIGIPFTKLYSKSLSLPYWRLPGIRDLKYGDIIVFNYPPEQNTHPDRKTPFMKRLVGFPGDSLQISDGQMQSGERKLQVNPLILYRHWVKVDSTINLAQYTYLLRKYNGNAAPHGNTILYMTREEAQALKEEDYVMELKEMTMAPGNEKEHLFPQSLYNGWTLDFFGPIWVPSKGDTIELNHTNLGYYEKIIRIFEAHELEVQADIILIDGAEAESYTFEMDYYFVVGDNWHNSSDSRHWGFVPEDHIIGTAKRVLINRSGGRFFHRIK